MRLYPSDYNCLWQPREVNPSSSTMNLVVATRQEGTHMRFDVEGRWRNGDALKLAYMVKATATRMRRDHVLIDLSRVGTPADADGKFLICDRLRRALAPGMRVVLVGTAELVDGQDVPQGLAHCPDVAVFSSEPEALDWLGGDDGKNPSGLRSEGLKGRGKKLEENPAVGLEYPARSGFHARLA
jgi:hypothetical protein